MPSWGELQEYAKSKYKLSVDEEQRFALVFGYDDGRSQQIFVVRFDAFDREWIEFRTAVCREEEMSPKVALRKNAELAVGSLALEEGMYLLLHNVGLKTMDLEEFEIPLHVLARTADNLEKQYASESDLY